jgi:hypothetical protein
MANKQWKIVEKKHTELIGGVRLGNLGEDLPDSASHYIANESKSTGYRYPITIEDWLLQAEINAKVLNEKPYIWMQAKNIEVAPEGFLEILPRIPTLMIHGTGRAYSEDLVILRAHHWGHILDLLQWR